METFGRLPASDVLTFRALAWGLLPVILGCVKQKNVNDV